MKYPRTTQGVLAEQVSSKYNDSYTDDKGYGIYAQRSYKPGEIVLRVDGVRIKDTDKRLTSRAIQIGKRLFVEPRRFSAIWYLNHSCRPNAYMDMDRLIARKTIRKGEEITTDYSLFTDFSTWEMDCLCGEKDCRKLILPYSRLRPKPKKFISSYLA